LGFILYCVACCNGECRPCHAVFCRLSALNRPANLDFRPPDGVRGRAGSAFAGGVFVAVFVAVFNFLSPLELELELYLFWPTDPKARFFPPELPSFGAPGPPLILNA